MERKPQAAGKEHETKKPYHKPEVIVYGNIRDITRNTGPKGAEEGGGGAAAGHNTGV